MLDFETDVWGISKAAAQAKAAAEEKAKVETEAKAAAERAAAESAAPERAAAAMTRALAEATLQLEASKGRQAHLVKMRLPAGNGLQVPPYWKNKTGINFVATNNFVQDALQRFMVESSCTHHTSCAATRQTRVVSVERVENELLWRQYQVRKATLKKNSVRRGSLLCVWMGCGRQETLSDDEDGVPLCVSDSESESENDSD